MTDSDLLRRFAEGSDEALGELVKRRIDLVYAAALRQTGGDVHGAKEITQDVFIDLVRKARVLASHPNLLGWLYTSTHFAVRNARRLEQRRQRHEQEAAEMQIAEQQTSSVDQWNTVRPVLDEAMHALTERDRQLVLLRFFDQQSFAAIGAQLGVSENAAQKIAVRALDRLHAALSRRGVSSSSSALATALAVQGAAAAPIGLASSVTTAAVAAGTTGVISNLAFWSFMNTTKLAAGGLGVVAAVAVGTVWYQQNSIKQRDQEAAFVEQMHARLNARLAELERRLAAETERARAAENDNQALLDAIAHSAAYAKKLSETSPVPEPVTYDDVQARYARGRERAKAGNWDLALEDLRWCYEEGMPRIAGFHGVRVSFLVAELGKMAKAHPPTRVWLAATRDTAERRMRESAENRDAAGDFAAIASALGERARVLAAFDELPSGDPRRLAMGSRVFEQLIDARRYRDALEARPYGFMTASASVERRSQSREHAINTMAKNVEVLAGAGELEHAKALLQTLWRFDSSPATHALVSQHLSRAGQPQLPVALGNP